MPSSSSEPVRISATYPLVLLNLAKIYMQNTNSISNRSASPYKPSYSGSKSALPATTSSQKSIILLI